MSDVHQGFEAQLSVLVGTWQAMVDWRAVVREIMQEERLSGVARSKEEDGNPRRHPVRSAQKAS